MNAIQLRPYQEDSIQGVRSFFALKNEVGERAFNRVILCGPTGCGKTVMFSYLAQKTLANSLTAKVLILTNRIELLTQAGGTLSAFGIRYELITATQKKINHRARCYVGMVETYANRIEKMPWLLDFTLVIIDECHYGNFKKLFPHFKKETFVIGATATPIAASKDDPLSNYYQALVNKVQIADLVEAGFLSPCITFVAKIDRSGLKKDSKGEYSEASQYDAYAKRSVYADLLTRYKEVCDRYNDGQPMRTICFNVNVAHSLEVMDQFKQAGYRTAHVDGTTKKAKNDNERKRIIDAYKAGEYDILNNVGILNAGFDDPETCCIIFNRASTSVSLWLQSCGRGSRIAEGKKRFVVIDMGDNWKELDPWDSPREWESIWNQSKRKSDKVGVAPAKECPNCKVLIGISAKVCTECGHEFEQKEREYAEATEFVELTSSMIVPKLSHHQKALLKLSTKDNWQRMPVDMLLQVQELKGYKLPWLVNTLLSRAESEADYLEDLQLVADQRNYKQSWVQYQLAKWTKEGEVLV